MKGKPFSNTIITCSLLFALLIAVHAFEAIVLRMDETFFAENFINKLFGIVVILIALRIWGWKWKDIGFSRTGAAKGIAVGLVLAIVSFSIAFAAEAAILSRQGKHISLGFFTTGFSLTGNTVVRDGIGFILMCVFFNIINVIMEEGTFRGLFYKVVRTDHSVKTAILFQAFLFGVWHIVTPLHNLIDGDINTATFIGLSVGYIILAGMMGAKWGLMYQMTGNLFSGMADHFFNNCIATNLLHMTTESGTDELMIVRVLIAQTLSFAIVTVVWRKTRHQGTLAERLAS